MSGSEFGRQPAVQLCQAPGQVGRLGKAAELDGKPVGKHVIIQIQEDSGNPPGQPVDEPGQEKIKNDAEEYCQRRQEGVLGDEVLCVEHFVILSAVKYGIGKEND